MAKDKLIKVYEGLTLSDAQLLADRLDDAGIESFSDQTDAPMDGLIAGPGQKRVYVRWEDAEQARVVVRQFEGEGSVGVHGEDAREREETGLELSAEQRPRDDSPSADIRGGGVERLNADRPDAEAPEVADLIDEPGLGASELDELDEARIEGFGLDRPLAQTADVETDEFEDQPIDRLDATHMMDERETGTAAANLRGSESRERSSTGRERREGGLKPGAAQGGAAGSGDAAKRGAFGSGRGKKSRR